MSSLDLQAYIYLTCNLTVNTLYSWNMHFNIRCFSSYGQGAKPTQHRSATVTFFFFSTRTAESEGFSFNSENLLDNLSEHIYTLEYEKRDTINL
jgi:hypothetical protein